MKTKSKSPTKPARKPAKKSRPGKSVSALAIELKVDRRTMAKVIRELQVQPVGVVRGAKVYDAEEATAALAAHREAAEAMSEPQQRLTLARARLAETKATLLKRDYVPVATVREWAASLTKDITAIVRQLHLEAPKLAGLGVAEIDARLKDVEHDLLTKLYGLRDPARG